MADSWQINYNPRTGIENRYHLSENGKFGIETIDHNISAKIEANKAQFLNTTNKFGEELRHVASIPPVVWMQLEKDGIAQDPNALRKWLDDSDNRVFKVRDTKLGKRDD